jgi:hypothetical protein
MPGWIGPVRVWAPVLRQARPGARAVMFAAAADGAACSAAGRPAAA